MNYFVFSSQFRKGMQITILLVMLLFSLSPGGVFSVYAAPPSNDNFANATVVTTGDIPYIPGSISTVDATVQSGEKAVPQLCDGRTLLPGTHTVWYKFISTTNALVSFDTVGSNFDTYIAVWTGTALTNLTFVACDDDIQSDFTSQLLLNAKAGNTYYIQVASFGGANGVPQEEPGGTLFFSVHFPNIDVYIGNLTTRLARYYVPGGTGERASYKNINNGPVKLINVDTVPSIAAERVIYKVNGVSTSFSEMMGLPGSLLSSTYWLPWYNNVDLDTQLRFGNVTTNQTATVHIWIGGQEVTGGCTPLNGPPYTLSPGASIRVSCAGINDGPVQIISNASIVAAERVIYKVKGVNTSFSEMMAMPDSQLDTTYWLPWYNNVDLDTQLRFGNVDPTQTATVHVKIGGQEVTSGCVPSNGPYTLLPGASIRVSCTGKNNGPVQIVSDGNVKIVAAERVIYRVNGVNTSFSEMMALPDNQVGNTYVLPWYNNKDLDTQLRFGNVDPLNQTATVHIYIGDKEMVTGNPSGSPYTLQPGESKRVSFTAINNGPVRIVSDVPIVAAERVIYKVNMIPTSFSEMMGLPDGLLDTTYWMPWYNNVDLDTQLRFGIP